MIFRATYGYRPLVTQEPNTDESKSLYRTPAGSFGGKGRAIVVRRADPAGEVQRLILPGIEPRDNSLNYAADALPSASGLLAVHAPKHVSEPIRDIRKVSPRLRETFREFGNGLHR